MNAVYPYIVPLLLIGAIVAAGLFLLRAWNNRSASTHAPYNVGRQEARVAMQANVIRAFFVIVVGVVLLGVLFAVRLFEPDSAEEPLVTVEPTRTQESPTATLETVLTATEEVVPVATDPVPATPTTQPIAEDTPTPTNEPLPTATDAPLTAVVSSGVGVWLRSTPSTEGEQLEWLLDGTSLILLDQIENTDTFTWQQVQAPSGLVGWVATDFIEVPQS